MKYHAKAKEGKLDYESNLKLVSFLLEHEGDDFEIIHVKSKNKKRTNSQNNSIHLYLEQRADALDREGVTLQDVVKAIRRAEIRPTMLALKEVVWKGIQKVMFKKESTTKLTKHEVDKVYEACEFFFQKEFPIAGHVPFPSQEELAKIDKKFTPNNPKTEQVLPWRKIDYPENNLTPKF